MLSETDEPAIIQLYRPKIDGIEVIMAEIPVLITYICNWVICFRTRSKYTVLATNH